jgi:tetratricopeptide (TPR) repeat protein
MAEPDRQIFPLSVGQPFETWQVGAVRMPLWLPGAGGAPYRPWVAFCLNLDFGKVLPSQPGPEEEVPDLLESVLADAGRKWRSQPARVEVAEVAWAQALDDLLSPQGVAVAAGSEMPELNEVMERLSRRAAQDDPRPGPLTGEGVTVEDLAAFAHAAVAFLEAAGWRHLNDEDLVRIEAPEVEAELRRFVLVHDGGRSAPELRFFPEPADLDFDDEDDDDEDAAGDPWDRESWTIELLKPWEAPREDGDLWEAHGLPWAGNGFIPVAGCWQGEDFRRPDHRRLALFEGLLRALTATAEADLDSGRWETQVATAAGPLRFVLSLPDLLEPSAAEPLFSPGLIWRVLERSMRDLGSMVGRGEGPFLDMEIDGLLGRREEGAPVEPAAGPEIPEGRAEALLDRAYAARGRRAVLLARQTLEVWPDCADAYCLLARRAPDPESGTRLLELGVAAGERALGPAVFAEGAGHFWGLVETRPYMRARQGLAESLVEVKRLAEAVEHFQAMLRLNPEDNQGIRHSLVNVLITLDRDAEAWELLDRYPEDGSTLLEYPRALLRFRREGDSLGARKALQRAVRANRFVPALLLQHLLHTRDLPPPTGFFSPGREDEAVLYHVLSCDVWSGTAGALGWLRQRTALPPKRGAKGKAKKRKKKRR